MKISLLAAGAALAFALSAPAIAAPQASPSPKAQSAVAQPAAVQLAQRDRDRKTDRDRSRSRDRSRDRSGDRSRSRDRNVNRNQRRNPHAYRERYPRGAYGRPHWSRGDRLYRDYRGPRYYVNDWHRYHLRRPPRGYRWVRVNDDFMLVAITTGIIMDVIMMNQMMNR